MKQDSLETKASNFQVRCLRKVGKVEKVETVEKGEKVEKVEKVYTSKLEKGLGNRNFETSTI